MISEGDKVHADVLKDEIEAAIRKFGAATRGEHMPDIHVSYHNFKTATPGLMPYVRVTLVDYQDYTAR